mmetsp:Transcript_16869/g.48266  ORF Transcript_16869/g.48266 Transcript_16869/m.48266 type:complete len:299 (+) Transcript_16869:915-1811(+)
MRSERDRLHDGLSRADLGPSHGQRGGGDAARRRAAWAGRGGGRLVALAADIAAGAAAARAAAPRRHRGAAPREARRGSGRGGGGDAADDVGAGAAAAVAARLRGASLALRRRVAGGAAPASARLVRLRAAAPLGLRPGQPAGEGGDCGPHAADAVPARASSPGHPHGRLGAAAPIRLLSAPGPLRPGASGAAELGLPDKGLNLRWSRGGRRRRGMLHVCRACQRRRCCGLQEARWPNAQHACPQHQPSVRTRRLSCTVGDLARISSCRVAFVDPVFVSALGLRRGDLNVDVSRVQLVR